MPKRLLLTLTALLFIALSIQSDALVRRTTATSPVAQSNAIPAPEDVLGFRPGDDRKLASWAKVVEYFQKLAATSDRVKFEEIGKSTMGAPFVFATISAPENLKRLEEFKEIQRQLADPRILGAQSNPALADRKARALIARGKTIVAITCGIHSTEVGSYLSSMLIAHRLASSSEPEIQEILRNTIILLVPSTNPDGVDIVNNWYQKTLGTPYEGTDPPELYHKYTGHDNNRDWYAFTQVETQLVVDKILNVWHPQIVHDIHQQGALGSRLFLPPYMQPVEPNVPKQIVDGYTELGNYIAGQMRAAGFKGITTNSTYDAWSPSRAYSHYHGGVRILSETASCRLATPITVKFDDLNSREGYDPKKESANFGPVWQGGEWHLRDITNNMTTAAFFLLKHAAQNREHWLQRFYKIGKEAVRRRKADELVGFQFLISPATPMSRESTKTLRRILTNAGIEIEQGFVPGFEVPWEIAFVKLAQPYGGFAKALFETQHYPDLRDSSGRPIPPYDVTAHSSAVLLGVNVEPVFEPIKNFVIPKTPVKEMKNPPDPYPLNNARFALYKSHVPTMDEGWTRWVIEHQLMHPPKYSSIEDNEVRAGNLHSNYDTIIIPDQARAAILNGYRAGAMPPEYTGGLGQEGVKALREFVEQGGTLICLSRASDFAIEQFKLPLRDVVDGLPRSDFFVPGSILRIELDTLDPIAKGMPKESIAWVENSPVFEIVGESASATLELERGPSPLSLAEGIKGKGTYGAQVPTPTFRQRERELALRVHPDGTSAVPASNVKIVARYPTNKDPLLSGWLLGGDRIKGKAALVEVRMGRGRIILFGFRPQYRGQSLATYPLLFNAITLK